MVKGISRQVIVLNTPDPKLFEQAIFILKEDALSSGGVTEDMLMKEARRLISHQNTSKRKKPGLYGALYAFAGALVTAAVWGLCLLI